MVETGGDQELLVVKKNAACREAEVVVSAEKKMVKVGEATAVVTLEVEVTAEVEAAVLLITVQASIN